MKILIDRVLTNFDGQELKTNKGDVMTLKNVIIDSLLLEHTDEGLKQADKLMLYKLSKRLFDHKEKTIDLTAEEIALIKKKVSKSYAPLIYGQISEMLEGSI